jgi:hypothetical protein
MINLGGAMPRLVQRAASFLILAVAISTIPMLLAEEPPAPPPAPLPAQIIAARKVFISNGGEDLWLDVDPKHDPDLTYNEFYASMKSWGKYELVSSPADADVVFEIHLAFRDSYFQLRLLILDPKTHVTLWPFNQVAKPAMRDATARKNLDQAMKALMESLKKQVPGSP